MIFGLKLQEIPVLACFKKLKKVSLHEDDHAKTGNRVQNGSEVGSEATLLESTATLCDLG